MKKTVCLLVVFALMVPVIALAEEAAKEETGSSPAMMPSGMGKMCAMMMGKATMVAGQDGGVIVLVGNKLQKYDNALNLVKEVTIPMPMPGMMGDKQCPMPGMMKPGTDAKAQEKAPSAEEAKQM